MSPPLPSYVRGELDFAIHDGVVEIILDGEQVSAMSLRKARIANARLAKRIREYEAKKAQVIMFKKDHG